MKLDKQTKEKIEVALNDNPECQRSIMNGERIFTTSINERSELLVLVDSRLIDCFGHVAYIKGKWSSALIDITGYIFGNTEEEIINDFWENIETRIGYDLPFVDEAAIDYLGADNYQQAITNLIEMIKLYKIALWEPKSYAIYDLYGSDPMIAGNNNTRF
jgi:hypothetical protein